ncbi:MAG: DUF4011 domain-containing protein [Alphaproteobacteria bacterium]
MSQPGASDGPPADRPRPASLLEQARQAVFDPDGHHPLLTADLRDHVRGLIPLAGPSLNGIFRALAMGEAQDLLVLPNDANDTAPSDPTLSGALADGMDADRLSADAFRTALAALPPSRLDADDTAYLIAERALEERVRERIGLPVSRAAAPVRSRAERARANGQPHSFDLVADEDVPGPPGLQTLLTGPEARRKILELGALDEEGRALHGASPLHVAYGFLHWRDGAGRNRFSPLLLQPISPILPPPSKDGSHAPGRIQARSGRPFLNPALFAALKMRGFSLPGMVRDERPRRYLQALQEALEGFTPARDQAWHLSPYCVLGAFDTASFRLWADLTPDHWAGIGPRAADPFLGSPADDQTFDGVPAPIEVVTAPPGTDHIGHIRSLVLDILGRGETVLVVAAPEGPLQAVARALGADGTGPDVRPFVLEAWAADRRGPDILKAIRTRHGLTRGAADQDPDTIRADLDAATMALEALEAPFAATGVTPADILRAEAKVADLSLAPAFDAVDLPHADQLDAEGRERCRIALSDLEKAWADRSETGPGKTAGPASGPSPWAALEHVPGTAGMQAVRKSLGQWLDALPRLIAAGTALAERIGLPAPASVEDISRLIAILPETRTLKALEADSTLALILPVLSDPATEAAARRLHGLWKQLDAIDADLKTSFDQVDTVSSRPDDVALLLQAWTRVPDPPETLVGIKNDLDALEARVEGVGQDRSFLNELAEALELPAPDTATDLTMLQEAAALVARTPRLCLQANRDALRDPAARGSVGHLIDEVRTLRSRYRNLNRHMRITLQIPPRALRRAANDLAETPFLLRPFLRRYDRARRLRDRLLRKPIRPGSAPALLRALGDFVRMVDHFDDRKEPVTLLGPLFRGIDTDTVLVEGVVEFVNRAGDFAAKGAFGEALAKTLCQCPADRLMRFAHAMDGEIGARVAEIRTHLEADGEDGIQALDLKLQVRQDAYDHILALGNTLGLKETVRFDQLDDAVARLRQRSTLVNGELPSLAPAIKALEGAGFDRARPARRVAALALLEDLLPQETRSGVGLDSMQWRRTFLSAPALRDAPALEAAKTQIQDLLADVRTIEGTLGRDLGQPVADLTGRSLATGLPLRDAVAWAARAMAGDPALDRAVTRARAKATEAGLEALVNACESAGVRSDLSPVFDKVYWQSLGRRLREAAKPPLDLTADPETLRARKRTLETTLAQAESGSLRRTLMNRPIPPGAGGTTPEHAREGVLLPHVLAGEVPFQLLFRQAPQTLQALLPCWLADPASLPALLPAPGVPFDHVIVLEANSLAEGPALAALLRAKRATLIGDDRLMPPAPPGQPWTDWTKDRSVSGGTMQRAPLFDRARAQAPDGLHLTMLTPQTNPGVLDFLNARLYGGRLTADETRGPTRPWADGAAVQRHPVDGLAMGGVNPVEARAIVDAAAEQMEREPDTTLGIVTATPRQADLILALIDRRRATDETVNAYLDRWMGQADGFFVRPVDATAGECRPIILVSLVWARAKPTWPVPRSFEHLSEPEGIRVAATLLSRATRRMHIFTSLSAEDLSGAGDAPEGVKLLKALLGVLENDIGTPSRYDL